MSHNLWIIGLSEYRITSYNVCYTKLLRGIAAGNPKIIKGRAGSPYAITDYYDINPDIAEKPENRMQEFEQLVERTHNAGMRNNFV